MNVKKSSLEPLIEINTQIKSDFSTAFSGLTSQQLNWKPSPTAWSIAQCVEHLIKTDSLNFPGLEASMEDNYQPKFLEKIPGLTNVCAKLFFWGLTTSRKIKAPAMFVPSSSDVPASVIRDFLVHQNQMQLMMQRSISLKAENRTFTDPYSPVIVFKLLDTFRISTLHAQRHFQQALNVKHNPNFPS